MSIRRSKPISEQVYDVLQKRILKGDYSPGSRMPSEFELAEELGISRTSLREGLNALASRGIIRRKQGDGTYVNQNVAELRSRLESFPSFLNIIEDAGRRASMDAESIKVRAANEQEVKALMIPPGNKVAVLKQRFWAEDTPVLLATYTLPARRFSGGIENCNALLPFPEFVDRYLDGKIRYVRSVTHAMLGPVEIWEELELKEGTPTLRLLDVFYDQEGHPLASSIIDCNDKAIDFYMYHLLD